MIIMISKLFMQYPTANRRVYFTERLSDVFRLNARSCGQSMGRCVHSTLVTHRRRKLLSKTAAAAAASDVYPAGLLRQVILLNGH